MTGEIVFLVLENTWNDYASKYHLSRLKPLGSVDNISEK